MTISRLFWFRRWPAGEALTEMLHERVRRDYWGYADESFSPEELIGEPIRASAPRRLSGPARSHRKADVVRSFEHDCRHGGRADRSRWRCGRGLRFPASIWSPEAYYFGVAKVEHDQVLDYAARKNIPVAEAELYPAKRGGDPNRGRKKRAWKLKIVLFIPHATV